MGLALYGTGNWRRRRRAKLEDEGDAGSVAGWAEARLGFRGDERQRALLDAEAKCVLICCTRQWGKSTVTAVRAVHHAVHRAGALVVMAGPTERQSGEILEKAARFLRILGIRRKTDGRNALSLVLPNGSRLVALPGEEATVRGFSAVTFLIVDEAGKVGDELYGALTPMLATTDGLLWVLGTPNGQSGFFYEGWTAGGAEWERVQVPATECERISAGFLARERKRLGDDAFRREYLCEFLPGPGQMFSEEMLDAAVEEGSR